jgi:steroid 5-alpha reductase family enzyme
MHVVEANTKHLTPPQRQNLQALAVILVLATAVKQKKAALLSLTLNFAVFSLHAWPNRSDKFYDTIGGITHLILAVFSIMNQKARPSHGQVLNTTLSVMWATRLTSFLFTRILVHKKDSRFNAIKKNYYSFLLAFTLQSMWCFLGQLPLLVSNTNKDDKDDLTWSMTDVIGRALFVIGIAFETISDAQKTAFHADPANHGKFITEGLWSLSRHPNHFGEICLQAGIGLSASRLFKSRLDTLAWLGPLFTTFLLTRVSGVPMLEKVGLERWGSDPAYLKYLEKTPLLVPKLF